MDIAGRSGEMTVFATVVQQGSLSAAARALGLTPSAISRIVGRLERRVGTRLMLRTTRTITLTAEGETYLRGAPLHAVFVGGATMPARVRAFVDFLVEHHTG